VLKQHSQFFKSLMLGADLVLVSAAWIGACLLRFSGFPVPLAHPRPPWRPYLFLLGAIPVIWAIVFQAFDLYRPRRLSTRSAEVRDIARACTVATLILIAVSFFVFLQTFEFSRLVFLYFWTLSIATLALARGAFREGLRLLRRRGYNQRHALIVGAGDLAARLVSALRQHPELGIRVVGLLAEEDGCGVNGLQVLGRYEDMGRVVTARGIDHVFVALPHTDFKQTQAILNQLAGSAVAIKILPDFGPLLRLCGTAEEFEGLPMLSLQDPPLYGWNRVLKRGFDLLGSGLLLSVLSPLLALVALLIRWVDGRPILYRQERMGLDGRRFQMLKFRTMRVDAELETGPVWTVPDDPRRTRLGGILRHFSLDELPQLWNVFKGEMSLVGPRPERPTFIEDFRRHVPQYLLRHKVKAGITGWAQVNGWRGNTPVTTRTEYDLFYIENWSLALDLKILWLTLRQGMLNRNAY
jgi:exopolysaccharide biosynthesis polyprenyl glycosylphosphotransferase